jgi:hypothetical protein
LLGEETPVEAANWLAEHPELPGNSWSDLSFSSYLVYALPERKVWIDTRFELYPVEQWQRYLTISSAGYEWEKLLEQEGVRLAMVSIIRQPRLLEAMEASANWCKIYHDEEVVIFQSQNVSNC